MLNLKMKITNKLKLFIIITVSVLFVGLLIFGICGFNQPIDFKKNYEVDVSLFSVDNSGEIANQATRSYFDGKDLSFKGYAFSMQEDTDQSQVTLKYKFSKDIFDKINVDALKTKIATALNGAEIGISADQVDVKFFDAKETTFTKAGWVTLALAVSVVAIFVYLFFMEKLASALSVICSGVLSAILFIAVMSIWRIPASPFASVMEIVSVFLTVVLSTGLITRFKEEFKNEGNAKLTNQEIADKVADSSILRFAVILAFVLLTALLLIIIGTAYLKFLGLQFMVVGLVSVFSSIVWTPNFWLLFKNFKKKQPKIKN